MGDTQGIVYAIDRKVGSTIEVAAILEHYGKLQDKLRNNLYVLRNSELVILSISHRSLR